MVVPKQSDKNYNNRTFVMAVARGFEILRCFTAIQPELGTADIAKLTGLPQSTVWRLCNTLVELGCLVRHPNSEKLSVGLGLLAFGYEALSSLDLGELIDIEMKRFADEFHAGISLSIRDNNEMLIVKRVRGEGGLLSGGRVGSRVPIVTSAAGWAFLATLSRDGLTSLSGELEQQAGCNWTRLRSIIDSELLRFEDKGFIINAGVYRPEINYVATPIMVNDKTYTLHCSALVSVLPVSMLETKVGPRFVELAGRIRIGLGRSRAMF